MKSASKSFNISMRFFMMKKSPAVTPPTGFEIVSVHPNPFKSKTTIVSPASPQSPSPLSNTLLLLPIAQLRYYPITKLSDNLIHAPTLIQPRLYGRWYVPKFRSIVHQRLAL